MNDMRQLIRSPSANLSLSGGSVEDIGLVSSHEPHPGISAAQVISILRFYWKFALLIAAAVVLLSTIVIKFLPKTFNATATLIVDRGKVDPLAAVANLSNAEMTGHFATQLELIESPIILLQVVDRIKLSADKEFAGGFNGSDKSALREYTERNLAEALKVESGRGGELVYITAAARDPVKAAEIANAVADTYMEEEENRQTVPAGDRARRYTEDLAQLRAKVAAAQDKLTAFQQQKGITDLNTGREATDTESQGLKSLEEHLLEAQNQRRALEARSAGQQSVADEAQSSLVIQRLKTQVSELQAKAAQLSATYGPKHPKVIEVRSQLGLATRQLNDEIQVLSANNATQLQRARELENKYTQAVAEQRAKVMNLREHQGEGAKLVLEVESAQSVYKRALDGYDHFLFASADKSSEVSLVSRATPPVKYTNPNKPKLMLMAMFLGLALGVVLPLLYEMLFDRRLRCRDDLERSLGIPVLAQFESFITVSSSK
ncbi:MAG TPA: GumC family protein [Steroidobacteraceae bacterium]|nr:GumC family protein [Steroidobacteraceae bacterium]